MPSRRTTIVALTVVLALAVLYFVVSWVIVQQALVAEAHALDQFPEDHGLGYEEVAFPPRGGEDLTLRGWWLPAASASEPLGTVIWVHGLDGNRASRLPLHAELVNSGFNVLVFDLRGHGESDWALMGAGIHEQDDVRGAIDYALGERGVRPGELFLFAESFGAGIALMVGPDEPAVAGVYSDSAWASLSDLLAEEVARRTPIPLFVARLLTPGMVVVGRVTKGIDIDEARPVDSVSRYSYRIGIAHCHNDDRIPYRHAILIRQNAPSGSAFVAYPCQHAGAYDVFPEQFTANVLDYLSTRLAELSEPAAQAVP